jgi:hypothetical protein
VSQLHTSSILRLKAHLYGATREPAETREKTRFRGSSLFRVRPRLRP